VHPVLAHSTKVIKVVSPLQTGGFFHHCSCKMLQIGIAFPIIRVANSVNALFSHYSIVAVFHLGLKTKYNEI
jgi:hypothetical protein